MKPGKRLNCCHEANFILHVSQKHEENKSQPLCGVTTQTVCFY